MSHIHSMAETRIPQILEKQLVEHKSKTEIARDLGVSRKTITRDTQTDLYHDIINELKALYITNLRDFMKGDENTYKMEATKEFGRVARTGFTRETKHTEDISIRATIDITEKRRQNEELIKSLELTPDQFNKWTEIAKPENLE